MKMKFLNNLLDSRTNVLVKGCYKICDENVEDKDDRRYERGL